MILRQQAFVGRKRMLKGNLHTHTTRSDGELSPEDAIRFYYERGYDFLALTDHRKYNYLNFAPEIPITIIPGMEFDCDFERSMEEGFRCFHTVSIGASRIDGNGFEQDDYYDSGIASNQEEYQSYLDWMHEKNNLTIYCHPQWSSTPARYFENLQGDFAMEIWNSQCALRHHNDMDAMYWDELLGQGKKIYGVASDDAHGSKIYGNGWVMVQSENHLKAIIKALKEGAFYSSCGPEIYDFYIDTERDKAVIECSPASIIRIQSDKHPTDFVESKDGTMTRAEFDLRSQAAWPGRYQYVRLTVIDRNGKYAWTNPIF